MNYEHYQKLLVKRDGAILRVTINAPEKRNALDTATQQEFGQIFTDISEDPEVRCVVLTGAGQAFSAGGDLPKMQEKIDKPHLFFKAIPNAKRIVHSMLDCPAPIVCRVNGDAMGLGATLALLGDIVIAAEDAKIGDPHVRVGLVAGDGGSVIWPQLIGFARAKRYLLTGDALTGREAADIGLVTFAVPAAELDAEVEKWAKRMATGASNAIMGTKLSINSTLKSIAATGMDVGMAYEGLSNISSDHQEAVSAFVGKRKAQFSGE